jgi:tRNA G46 methylase TrmB
MIAQPTFRNRIYLFARTFRTRGMRKALQHIFSKLTAALSNRQNTTHTLRRVFSSSVNRRMPGDLRIRSMHEKWGVHYVPTPSDVFRKAIGSLPIPLGEYTFVDLGAGKGEMLLQAAEYGFKKIVGVEYSGTLAEDACANIRGAMLSPSKDVSCLCMDAVDFVFPEDPTVLYLYNPFQGKVMDKVVENIRRSLETTPRDLWIIYVNPWEHRKFIRGHYFQTAVENWGIASSSSSAFCIYRSILGTQAKREAA